MNPVIQTIIGMIATAGFAVMLNVRGSRLLCTAIGSGITWITYLLAYAYWKDPVPATLAATLVTEFLSEVLARLVKTPVPVLLVPMLIPVIPGGALYYATSDLVTGHMEAFSRSGNLVLMEAGAIAFGIILMTSVFQIIMKIISRIHHLK